MCRSVRRWQTSPLDLNLTRSMLLRIISYAMAKKQSGLSIRKSAGHPLAQLSNCLRLCLMRIKGQTTNTCQAFRSSSTRFRDAEVNTYFDSQDTNQGQSLAMQRWQDSPPQDESASLSAIYRALQSPPESGNSYNNGSFYADPYLTYRSPPSIRSHNSGASTSSLQSDNSTSSQSLVSSPSFRQYRRRANRKGPSTGIKDRGRIFKCTFCCDTFKHKYDWARHEKTIHLCVEEWQCAPYGGFVAMGSTGRLHCAYCSALDPTVDHLDQHNHNACRSNQPTPRKFSRKDHLIQHLRHFHGVDVLPILDGWMIEPVQITSRCGFCNTTLNSWGERSDHLTAHFRKGKTMADWHGDHGFDAAVAARVTYAIAPYLIADDSMSIIPFSATNPASMDHFNQISPQVTSLASQAPALPVATEDLALPTGHLLSQQPINPVAFADVLTQHLGRFARQQLSMSVIPTDEMFQRESRRVMFGDEEDNWNQTLADNQDWLEAFRQQNGW
ncbi:hypothetical protein BKA63DRAFT_522901 [Paraphoma chrysanthemicola]|nr:hypothetical protein BKA63DRAFT_522901 [Paraphoma chrysanthemicola]